MDVQIEIKNSKEWKDCLNYISHRMKEQSFNTWLKPTRGEYNGNGEFKIAVPNQFVADWIDSHFREVMDEAFKEVLGRTFVVNYVISETTNKEQQVALEFEQTAPVTVQHNEVQTSARSNLSSRYQFNSLVVGDFNQFACAASMAVADEPGTSRYNPLCIYGGTGLGKTHIAQAIGHRILEQFPSKRVIYATSEKFTSDFIASISEGSIAQFTSAYRNVDALIIDDIQFFNGKESTQEQFFHTFNTLYHFGKQIVLTSDRPPRDLKGLEERLLSRFSWGLVTDLQAPDLENRMAILYKKLESEGVSFPDDVIRYVAGRINTNVRELEGTLIRLLAYSSHMKVPVDINLAKKLLTDNFAHQKKQVTIDTIQKKTSECFNIDPLMMKAKKKTYHIALARQVAMYLSRSLTNNSLKVIGSEFGGRDHSTVIHGCDLISKKMSDDAEFRNQIDQISASLLY
ncbi:MAG: chromosomal replication initiator protein DnaA [candidate division Zixibacteria bacterium]|nr:chromosomal replication initiator protein DnaA [candidate division Zixibacteria bacterium]